MSEITAIVSTSEEDKIEIQVLSSKEYIYSFYSKGRKEFSTKINDFSKIENSILAQFPSTGKDLVDNIKHQLCL